MLERPLDGAFDLMGYLADGEFGNIAERRRAVVLHERNLCYKAAE